MVNNKTTIKEDITILSVGDISYSRDIEKYIKKRKNNDYKYPLSYVKKYLKNSDITLINLETTITESNKASHMTPVFKSSPKCLEGLKDANINLVNLANNHMNDYGIEGIKNTKKYLRNSKIDFIGVKNNIYKIYNFYFIKIGFLGISAIFRKLINSEVNIINNKDFIIKQIQDIKKKCDILILSIHWGKQYKLIRSKEKYNLGKLFIENGVDIILGHHPHVLQELDTFHIKDNKNKIIRKGYLFNSLGNFLFDSHVKNHGTRNTCILKININKNKDIRFSYLPCVIYPQYGFIPIPISNYYQKKFPQVSNNYANNLYKYMGCASHAKCNSYKIILDTNRFYSIYFHIFIIIITILILIVIFTKNLKIIK